MYERVRACLFLPGFLHTIAGRLTGMAPEEEEEEGKINGTSASWWHCQHTATQAISISYVYLHSSGKGAIFP